MAPLSLVAVLPELLLVTAGCAILLLGQGASGRLPGRSVPWVALGAVIVGAALLHLLPSTADGALLHFGPLADFVRISTLLVGVVLLLVGWTSGRGDERGEVFAMALFSLAGLMLVGSADDLVILFLAVELVSIPTYVMVVLSRRGARPLEAATKYFYLGAMSAAIMAYGFSFLYGVAGSSRLPDVVHAVRAALSDAAQLEYGFAMIGLVLSLGGLFFKIAAVPLHLYIADVYQGASSAVAGFLGYVPKFAGIVAIMQIVRLTGVETDAGPLFFLLWLVAALSMTVGNMLAFRQKSVKRMLGYSGIAHAGYMLVGVIAAGGGEGAAAVLFYVVAYGLANLAAFGVLGQLVYRGEAAEKIVHVAGLIRREPGLALVMVLAMFTLMGMPITVGFWGKWALFTSAMATAQVSLTASNWIVALVVIAVINSAIGAAYYLRVAASCILYEPEDTAYARPAEAPLFGTLMCGFLLLLFMFVPGRLFRAGQVAATQFREVRVEYYNAEAAADRRPQALAEPKPDAHDVTDDSLARGGQ